MSYEINGIRVGLLLVMLTLIFGIGMGTYFGVAEDSVKTYISDGVAAHPEVHDEKSTSKIWRYAQRSHFHATGISAFSIGLILLIMFSNLKPSLKAFSSTLVGLGGLYPMSWFSMFILAPSLGREAAHHHIITEIFTYVGGGGLLLGLAILCANLFFNMFSDPKSFAS
jgi:hypothetical protein